LVKKQGKARYATSGIRKASHTGFCFGVKRAIGIAERILKQDKKVCSLGPVIHNRVVVDALSKKGLNVIDDIRKAKGACVLIRSHGISPDLREKAKRLSIEVVDATCPFVKRSHDIVTSLKSQGYKVIIIGEKSHPEIKALSAVAGKGAVVVRDASDLKVLRLHRKKVGAVAQTTLSRDKFLGIAGSLLHCDLFECRIFDTICNDVVQRQTEAKELAKNVDIVVVVGGKISANTAHLARICRDLGTKTYHVETEKELRPAWFRNEVSVGVVSGASTPDAIVSRVVARLREIKKKQVTADKKKII